MAVAENVFDPIKAGRAMAEVVAGKTDIEDKLRAVIDLLAASSQRGVLVMMAVRSAVMEETDPEVRSVCRAAEALARLRLDSA